MAPTYILRNLLQRDDSNIDINITPSNPLQDHTFVATVVGLITGAVLFLVLIGLFLFLYRENSPVSRCCSRRRKPMPEPKLESIPSRDSLSTSSANSETVFPKNEDLSHHLQSNSWVDKVRYSVVLPSR